jgi:hypothetical protein
MPGSGRPFAAAQGDTSGGKRPFAAAQGDTSGGKRPFAAAQGDMLMHYGKTWIEQNLLIY